MDPRDISEAELSEFISKFSEEKDSPEKPSHKVDAADWLSPDSFDASQVQLIEFEGGLEGYGIYLKNVLSRTECKRIIGETEKLGYGFLGRGGTGMAYRGNHRMQIDDIKGKLGENLWERIKAFVPESESLPGDAGTYTFHRLNERYRFAKYFPGQGFALHKDKPTIFEKEICSIYTVNIYLNDLKPEQAGRTRMFTKLTSVKKKEDPVACAGGFAGSVLIFKQNLVDYSPVHDGDQLKSGLKYLMRTDVVYTYTE